MLLHESKVKPRMSVNNNDLVGYNSSLGMLAFTHKSNPCCVYTFYEYTLKFPCSAIHRNLVVMPQGKAFN